MSPSSATSSESTDSQTVSWSSKGFTSGLQQVTDADIAAVKAGDGLSGLGPESDAVIFFSSG